MQAPRAHLFFSRTAPAAFIVAGLVFLGTLYVFRKTTVVFDTPGQNLSLPVKDSVPARDTIPSRHPGLRFRNNLFYINGGLFSGVIRACYANGKTQFLVPVYAGMRHGIYRSFYADGSIFEIRCYQHNLANGRHLGYWRNGKRKFDYQYRDDRRNGYLYQWYENGKPYMVTHYIQDQEDGLQQAWRTSGKLFINYVAKNGRKYGLEETQLCYTVRKQQIPKL
ncbi:toxin-antitoxin system YwqK family antitoxin [Sediminibacterium soli]|uniref:toxin-antitoxin system YwqK family antitoxin n=1 Tax=Sediminibacterium soli TaxID=2698829 RepID=UPI00137A288D|nr:hypothetical protein [Sediminibacterium soli]NCI45349.1 hypothetical protein [Sediminibacterium soli]